MSNQTNETNHLVQFTQPTTHAHKAHYSKKSKVIKSLSLGRLAFHLIWVLLSFTYVNAMISGVFIQINPNTPDWVSGWLAAAVLWFSHGLLFSSLESNLYTTLDEDDSTNVDWIDWGLCAGLFVLLLWVGVKGAPEAIAAFSKKEHKEMLSFSDVEQQVAQQKADAKDAFDENIRDINNDIERETNKAAAAANSEIARLTNYKPHNFNDKMYAQGLLKKAEQQKSAIISRIEAKYNAQKKPFRSQYNASIQRIESEAGELKASKRKMIDEKNEGIDKKQDTINSLGVWIELAFAFLCLLTTFLYVRNRVLCGIIPKARYTELDASGNLTIWGYVISDIFQRVNQYAAIFIHREVGKGFYNVIRPDGTVVATDGNYLSGNTSEKVETTKNLGGSDSSSQGGGSSPKPTPTTPPQAGAPEGGSNPLSRPAQAAPSAKPTAASTGVLEAMSAEEARAIAYQRFGNYDDLSPTDQEICKGFVRNLMYPQLRKTEQPSIGIPNPIAECSFPTPKVAETVDNERGTDESAIKTPFINEKLVPQVPQENKTAKGDKGLSQLRGTIQKSHTNWNRNKRDVKIGNDKVYFIYEENLDEALSMLITPEYHFSIDVLNDFLAFTEVCEAELIENGYTYPRIETLKEHLKEKIMQIS